MSRLVRCGLVQCRVPLQADQATPRQIKERMIEKQVSFVEKAGRSGVQVLCLQELFWGPYFCAEQSTKWYDMAEPIPGPTVRLMARYARKYKMVIVVPLHETPLPGLYYNTAAVLDDRGKLLGIYRKTHLPHCLPGFWEKFYFKPGNTGYKVFETRYAKIGVYLCYDRHFPEGARALGLKGAEIVFNPSATVSGLAEHLWKLEQPAHAVANQYFVGCVNRVGIERPWKIGNFFGSSYFADTRGKIITTASRDKDELLKADLDLDQILETRKTWQFFRDRRPETYSELTATLP